MKKEFIKTTLPSGKHATILDGTGFHYFRAAINSNGNTQLMIKLLMIELIEIDGKQITEEELDEMQISDIVHISDIIVAMMTSPEKEYGK